MAFGDNIGLLFTLKAKDEASSVVGQARGEIDREVKGMEAVFNRLGSSVGLTNNQVSSLAKGLPIAGAAIGVISSAAVAAGGAVFEMARRSSDAGSKLFDMSRNTGVSTQALSAFKVAADQSGESIETVGAGIGRFTRLVSEAARGNDEATAALKRFGIDPQEALTDIEGALTKVIARIGELPEGAQRAAAAQMVFGRGGAQLVSTLEAMGFSLDQARRKAEELGQSFTGAEAKAMDDFGDAMDDLEKSGAGLAYTFGKEVAPAITEAMQAASRAIDENKDAVKGWGASFGDVLRGAVAVAESQGSRIVDSLWFSMQGSPHFATLNLFLKGLGALGGMQRRADAAGVDEGGSAADWDEANRIIAERQKAGADSLFANEKGAEEARKAGEKAEKEWEQHVERQAEKEKAARERTLTMLQASHAHALEMERTRARMSLAIIEDLEERKQITHEAAARQRETIERDEQRLRLANIASELAAAKTLKLDSDTIRGLERQLELQRQVTEAVATEADIRTRGAIREDSIAVQENTVKRLENLSAIMQQAEALTRLSLAGPIGPQGPGPGQMPNFPAPNANGDLPGNLLPPEWLEQNPDPPPVFDVMKEAIGVFKDFTVDAFGGIASGFGGMIQGFLLGGPAAQKSFSAMAKAAITGLSAQAGVQALMELAHAAAEYAKALSNPFTAPLHIAAAKMHLTAAAAYGLVSGAAAAISLAIPGGGGGYAGAAYAAGSGGGIEGDREDNRTRYMREQAGRDQYTRREDRRSESRLEFPINLDGRQIARAVVDVIRGGGDERDQLKVSLA